MYFCPSCTENKPQKNNPNELKDQSSLVQKKISQNTARSYNLSELSELKYIQKLYQELLSHKDRDAYLVTETHYWAGSEETPIFYHLFYTKKEAEDFLKLKKREIAITGVNLELEEDKVVVDPDTILLIIAQRYNTTNSNSPAAAFLLWTIEKWEAIRNTNNR